MLLAAMPPYRPIGGMIILKTVKDNCYLPPADLWSISDQRWP